MIEKKFLILLLEDSEYQAEQIVEFLTGAGRKIIAVDSIKKAKRSMRNKGKEFDLIILDLTLPDGNGMDFLRYIRRSKHTTPVILTSAYISDKVHKDADRLQVHNYLEKPLSMNALQNEVDIVLHM